MGFSKARVQGCKGARIEKRAPLLIGVGVSGIGFGVWGVGFELLASSQGALFNAFGVPNPKPDTRYPNPDEQGCTLLDPCTLAPLHPCFSSDF